MSSKNSVQKWPSTPETARMRIDGEAGRALERHRDRGEPAVLRRVPVGARQAQPVVGLRRARAPHLRAVEDVAVAVAREPRERAGHVGSATGLGQELHPLLVAAQHAREVAQLQHLGAVVEQRRGHHADRHHVARRHAPPHLLGGVEEHLLVLEREPGTAVLLRERDARESGVEDLLLQLVIGERLVAFVRGGSGRSTRARRSPNASRLSIVNVASRPSDPPQTSRSVQSRSLCSSGEPYTARLTAARRE